MYQILAVSFWLILYCISLNAMDKPLVLHVTVNNANNQVAPVSTLITDRKSPFSKNNIKPLQSVWQNIGEYIQKHRTLTIVCCAVSIWGAIAYKVWSLLSLLEHEHIWTRWYADASFEILREYPPKELTQQLIIAIQKTYTVPTSPTDFIQPLISFTHALEREHHDLQVYIAWCTMLKKLRLDTLFTIDQATIPVAQDRIKKLAYLKTLFSNWTIDYKINAALIPTTT